MLSDRQVIELVRRTDPVPNVDDLPEPRLDAAALLAAADKERAMSTVTDHPLTRPVPGPSRLRRLRTKLAFGVTVVVGLAVIGVVGVLGSGDESPAGQAVTTVATSTDTEGLSWSPTSGARGLETVRALVPGCCYNVALGDDSWVIGFGESFTGPGAFPIPPEIGPLRSIAANGASDMVAVPAVGPSTTPYVATYDSTPRVQGWTTAALPTEVPSPHPDVVMNYTVGSVAFSGYTFAAYGWAQPEIDPAAVAREYPELAPVVQTNLIPQCCGSEPLSTEIPDPLWVVTADPSSEPTAISLSTFGLTRQDLGDTVGVVWVLDRRSGPAPWVARTVLLADDAGPDWFLDSGKIGGFTLLTGRATGGYDAWTSPSGAEWTKRESILGDVADLAVWEGRALVLTSDGTILGLKPDDSWASFADASAFYLPGSEPADPVRIEAGDSGVVVVGEREQVLPWSDGEPIPTAQVIWFSRAGSTWQHQELSDIFGDIGAVDILVTIHEEHREVPASIIVALGVDQANGAPITDPQWWKARP